MPLPRVLPRVSKALPKWPDPAESIGRQIMSHRIGRRNAWWPRGPALERFEKDILPEIEAILNSIDLSYADIFIKLYMIGREPHKANPIIMICCTNRDTRNNIEDRIRTSDLLEKYEGFGLGATALPLENSAPSRLLGGKSDYHTYEDSIDLANSLPSSWKPKVGERLYLDTPSRDDPFDSATGSVIIQVDGRYFQLTVSHFHDIEAISHRDNASFDVSDDCHFDTLMDDTDSDSEVDELYDLAATSRGSLTPVSHTSQEKMTSSRTEESSSGIMERDVTRSDVGFKALPSIQVSEPTNPLCIIGSIQHNGSWIWPLYCWIWPLSSSLDYSLVELPPEPVRQAKNGINSVEYDRTLRIRKIARVGPEERAVIVVTSSTNPIKGILLPGAISYKPQNKSEVQRIFQVELEVAAVRGNCGAAILDEQSGDLYGHLFLGGMGSLIAYFIPAVDVFKDIIKVMGGAVTIINGDSYDASSFCNQRDRNESKSGLLLTVPHDLSSYTDYNTNWDEAIDLIFVDEERKDGLYSVGALQEALGQANTKIEHLQKLYGEEGKRTKDLEQRNKELESILDRQMDQIMALKATVSLMKQEWPEHTRLRLA